MEAKWKVVAITAVAPIAWGSTYYVTRNFLPDEPLWGAAVRAVPAGLILLAIARTLPHGAWWWRSAVLGVLNVGAFFGLVYIAAVRLPSSVAAVVMAMAPLVMVLLAWLIDAERPRRATVFASLAGLLGVALIVEGGVARPDPWGLGASVLAMCSSSTGFVLSRRWSRRDSVPIVASTAWQLLAGGCFITVVAALADGAPPRLDVGEATGFAYLALVATALGFVCWFYGLSRLDVGSVGVVGLLNPVTGVLLGTLLAAEVLVAAQMVGIVVVLAAVLVATHAPRRTARGATEAAEGAGEETGSLPATRGS